MALKKALFKPAAFFKGILLPLAESGNCTLREATIVSSILAKCSIPMLHSRYYTYMCLHVWLGFLFDLSAVRISVIRMSATLVLVKGRLHYLHM